MSPPGLDWEMRGKKRHASLALLLAAAGLFLFPRVGRGGDSPASMQEPLPGPSPEQVPYGASAAPLIRTLLEDPSPEARAAAAGALGFMGSGPAIEALRQALRDDPEGSVRAAAAGALGRIGPPARTALPDLILALDQGSADGAPCLAAAQALGRFGYSAATAVRPLARAAATRCGGAGDEPRSALATIASDVSARAEALTREEMEAFLADFRTAEEEMGIALPAAALLSLRNIEGVVGGRRSDWRKDGAALFGLLMDALGSATRSLGGILAAILAVGLLILGLRNAGRLLPPGTPGRFGVRPFRWGRTEVEIWLKRPGRSARRTGLDTSQVAAFLRRRAREEGVVLGGEDTVYEEHWDRFARSAAGGTVPAFAESRWVEDVLADAKAGRELSPPGSMVDVILGEVEARYVPSPGAPPRGHVTRAIQAVAWETMKRGSFSGWVPTKDLLSLGPEPEVAVILEYAEKEMGFIRRDPRKQRVQLSADEEHTARLGSLHLLGSGKASSADILGHIGAIQAAAIHQVGKARAPAFLRTVAGAFLDAANALEDRGPDLGIAEEALAELAEIREEPKGGNGSGRGTELAPGGHPGRPDERALVRADRLLGRLRSESHPVVRERIIRAIGELGPPARRALPALVASVEKDPAGVAVAAVEALGGIGPDAGAAAPVLLEQLEKGHPSMRLAAVKALGRMGPSGAVAAPTLLRWTSQGGVPHELRARAAEALGGMPEEIGTSIPTLAELLRSEVATEVRAAAALALARLDPGRKDVEEVLEWASQSADPALRGMVGIALLVRERRLSSAKRAQGARSARGWLAPMAITAGVLGILQAGALLGTRVLTPGSVMPALFVTPALAFLAGIAYAVATRRLPTHPALGGGLTGWAGASAGLLLGFLFASTVSPAALAVGGSLALGSAAFGGTLVRTALGPP